MRVIKPVAITDSILDSSTIPEPDTGETVWTAGTRNLGERFISIVTHRIYEVVADPSTTDDPVIGVDANPPTWVNVAPTNKFAMFDNINSTQSLETTQLIIEITAGEITNSIACFSIEEVTKINVTVTDPIEGVVYNRDVDMNDNSEITDWYNYYFSQIVRVKQFALLDLPAFPLATIKMTVDGNDIKFGSFVLGNQIELGVANYGTSVQLLDFSRKETDSFGNIVVVKGRTSKLVSFDVTIPKGKVNFVFNAVSAITTIPSVWIGDDGTNDPTFVFGYYRDLQINIDTPTITSATLQIEGIV